MTIPRALPPPAAAAAAGLRYALDEGAGLTRARAGKGFTYRDARGRTIRDASQLARIRSLAIPPAWTDVWISPAATGHIQATGRDAKGRKQYRYHPRWRTARDETKYQRLMAFARLLPRIRARVDRDLARDGLTREKVIATVVRLLEATLIRVGNEEYARQNRSYGLTTMRDRHASVSGERVRFRFRGKSGRDHVIDLHDRRLSRIVKRCQDLPGQQLFQYVDDRGHRRAIESADVNAYLREVTGGDFTAKDFRTWSGTVLAAWALHGSRQTPQAPVRPVYGASTRDERALRQDLPGQAAASGAERAPDRHLLRAAGRAREQQVRHVRAGDQEQEPHGAQQHQQRRAHVAHDDVLERAHQEPLHRPRVLGLHPRGDGGDFRAAALDRHARRQLGEEPQAAPAAAVHAVAQRERRPHLRAARPERREVEARRHHAHDRVRRSVEAHRASQHGRVPRERPPPQRVPEQDDVLAARLLLLGRERAPQERARARHLQDPGRQAQPGHRLGAAVRGQVRMPELGDTHRAERRRVRSDLAERRGRDRVASVVQHDGQPLGLRVRQRLQQDRVHRTEDDRGRPDPERQGGRRGGREAGCARQLPRAVADVLPDVVDPRVAHSSLPVDPSDGETMGRADRLAA